MKVVIKDTVVFMVVACVLLTSNLGVYAETVVFYVHPQEGSVSGDTAITIFGTGFAKNQFNFGEDQAHLGNKVTLISDKQSYSCDVLKESSHETQIACHTRSMPNDLYNVCVAIDGEKVPEENHCPERGKSLCQFQAQWENTPQITSVEPVSGPPGTIIKVTGTLYTSLILSTDEQSTNGNTNRIQRVSIGNQRCDLLSEENPDQLYGIQLDDDGLSDIGWLKCKITGNHIGNTNVNFLVSGPYGRSYPHLNTKFISKSTELHMFQTFAIISEVSPQAGSLLGGTEIHITGKFFDASSPRVSVGGMPCDIIAPVTLTKIVCKSPTKPPIQTSCYPGNRGVHVHVWKTGYIRGVENLDEVRSYPMEEGDTYERRWSDGAGYEEDADEKKEENDYSVLIKGFFVPPVNGLYTFYWTVADVGVAYFSETGDPADMVKIVECADSCTYKTDEENRGYDSDTQISQDFNLNAEKPYYFEIISSVSGGGESVNLGLKMPQTVYLESQTTKALNERQKVTITSTVLPEVQMIRFQDWTDSVDGINEVQKITVTSSSGNPDDGATFELALYREKTTGMTLISTASDVASALQSLPSITSVTVSELAVDSGKEFTIAFNDDLGDIPTLSVSSLLLNVEVVEVTKGLKDPRDIRLKMGNIVSGPVIHTADIQQLGSAIWGMFSVICHALIDGTGVSSQIVRYHFDFEEPDNDKFMGWGTFDDGSSFCGRYALKNPQYILKTGGTIRALEIARYNYACFAYKGKFVSKIRATFTWTFSGEPVSKDIQYEFIDIMSDTDNGKSWKYTCVPIYDLIITAQPDGERYTLEELLVFPASTESVVDEVQFRRDISEDLAQLLSVRRDSAMNARIKEVSVSKTADNEFHVTLFPYSCVASFEVFSLVGVEELSDTMLDGQRTVVYRDTRWPDNQRVEVEQIQQATPPVTGDYQLTFKDNTIVVQADTEAVGLQEELQTMPGMGHVSVVREGNCAGYSWTIHWLDTPGDQPTLQVDGFNLAGDDVSIKVHTLTDGGVLYKRIPGDMVRTCEEEPQVAVYINDIPSRCTGNCAFNWTEESTPVVTAIEPTSGSLASDTVLTITGSGLTAVTSTDSVYPSTVEIAGVVCDISSHTDTEIQCSVGEGPLGTHDVHVNIQGKGLATLQQFTYEGHVESISPLECSEAGGIRLTIVGSGFTEDSSVTVGGVECPVTLVSYTVIHCTVPMKSSDSPYSAEVVVLTQSGDLTSSHNLQYSHPLTPIVTAISQTTSAVWGGETVWIVGTRLTPPDATELCVKLCGTEAGILQHNETDIEITLPPNSPGFCPVKVQVGTLGNADISGVPDVEYTLSIGAVHPTKGSLYGGTLLTLSGEGFPENASLLTISLGDDQSCKVEHISEDTVVCEVSSSGKLHRITNQGSDPDLGQGYAWEPSVLHIETGDTVMWSWSAPNQVTKKVYSVRQIPTAHSNEASQGGFASGNEGTVSGVFIHQFPIPDTYFYWSGELDSTGFSMKGIITVTQKPTVTRKITVKVAGFQAIYNTDSGHSIPSSGQCTGTVSPAPGCTEETITQANDLTVDTFQWTYSACHTPVITDIQPRRLYLDEAIVITGNGFGDVNCQNEVSIGDTICIVDASTEDTITCHVDLAMEPLVFTHLLPSLRVNNRGYGLIEITDEFTVVFDRYIADISPQIGSTVGGTLVTIGGAGFPVANQGLLIYIGTAICDVKSIEYNKITCETRSAQAVSDVPVIVSELGAGDIVCRSGTCVFSYSEDATIVVDSVSPTTISGPSDTITLHGNFYDFSTDVLQITVGHVPCVVTSSSSSTIDCVVENLITGSHMLVMRVDPYGLAEIDDDTSIISMTGSVTSVVPTEGSIMGGTRIVLSGGIFNPESTTVTLGQHEEDCVIETVESDSIVCITPVAPNGEGEEELKVTTNGVALTSELTFRYTIDKTPLLSLVSPTTASKSVRLQLRGAHFSDTEADNIVNIGDIPVPVTSANDTDLMCDLPVIETGRFHVGLSVRNLGRAIIEEGLEFQFIPSVSDVSPDSGSFGGGQLLTFTGSGLMSSLGNTVVRVCGQPCVITSNSLLQIQCLTSHYEGVGSVDCEVSVTVNGLRVDRSPIYTYVKSKTPEISSVSPRRAGTGGGTRITIQGARFGDTPSAVTVTIADVACDVDTSQTTTTTVICVTNSISMTTKTKVRLQVNDQGIAALQNADFEYIDLWSSVWTWGGESLPVEEDLVVIRTGQTVLLDTDTPILKMLLIQGGILIFDRKDIELNAEYILITNGGVFQVGTEDEPFLQTALITLYGHVRSKELPIYGAKNIALREGTLDLHGKHVPDTWTQLSSTALAGTTTIQVQLALSWQVGDQIVIAATGDQNSQGETEVRTIVSISDDGRTIAIDQPLDYNHISIKEDINGANVEMRGEVGLLTHNIRIQGSTDYKLNEQIEVCPNVLHPGETCYQSQAGNDVLTGRYGCHIMVHPLSMSTGQVIVRIEHVEIYYAGQEFRLGRYPIHFHLAGDMTGSYVRGSAIYNTFNRAINIHGTHNLLIERNVLYDVYGGALFLEDGIETGNIFQYNLAVFVKSSTSLTNDDITPAAFWVTNPNNTIRHNAVAGGTHFGFWYHMHDNPVGPSFNEGVCPRKVPLGEFYNNSAHSLGRYGLWIFQAYTPTKDGRCKSKKPAPAVFKSLIAWNCEKGAEWVYCSDIQFLNFILINNHKAGAEAKRSDTTRKYSETGPIIADGLIVGHTSISSGKECTNTALVLPFDAGLIIRNMVFVNFDRKCNIFGVTSLRGSCSEYCGGWHYYTEGITLINSPNVYSWRWEYEGVLVDGDGSLTGQPASKLLPWSDILPPDRCSRDVVYGPRSSVPGAHCTSDVTFIRLAMHNPKPNSLKNKRVELKNAYGGTSSPWVKKRITYKDGWMALLAAKQSYTMSFPNGQEMSNVSYDALYSGLQNDDWVIMALKLKKKPDSVRVKKKFGRDGSLTPLSHTRNTDGDWFYDDYQKELSYMVCRELPTRKKRSTTVALYDSVVNFKVSKCFYPGCVVPTDPSQELSTESRPKNAVMWSDSNTWESMAMGKPAENDSITIPKDIWMVVDENLPKLGTLIIEGTLEFEDEEGGVYIHFDIHVDYLIIKGGLIIGWPDKPFKSSATISVHGTRDSPDFDNQSADLEFGPTVGSKVIGVFGRLDLHGSSHNIQWTQLAQTALAGSTQITLEDKVDWTVGSDIVITTTSYSAWQTETMRITSVSSDLQTLGLNDFLQYTHLGNTYDVPGAPDTIPHVSYTIKAKVGLLTRNVKIIGAAYDQMKQHSFGARVLVSSVAGVNKNYVARLCVASSEERNIEVKHRATGFARLSNVEFYNTGQEGFSEFYDPRFSLAILDVGDINEIRPSIVINCSFHNGFSTAIGVIGTNKLIVENNIIHHTVGNGIQVWGTKNFVIRNLVTLVIWPGTYNGRKESLNYEWSAGISAEKAVDLTMRDNCVAGSERSAFNVPGETCGMPAPQYTNNEAVGVLSGVIVFPSYALEEKCILLNGFHVTRANDYGLYYQGEASLKVSNSLFVDNGVGIFPMVTQPPSKFHKRKDKFVEISRSIFIGTSPDLDCIIDSYPSNDNFLLSEQARSFRSPSGGRIAMSWPNFISGGNGAPRRRWGGHTTYASIGGRMLVTDCHFGHFTINLCGQQDVVFSPNPDNQELHHPVTVQRSTSGDVNIAGKLFIPRADIGKVNPNSCVDMDCDGMKTSSLTDVDGSFLGGPRRATIPEAEFEWDGDQRRGLGDYRIPKAMLTDPSGGQLNVTDVAPKKGIIRNENCVYHEAWQAYECSDLDYKMLVIESLDADTETRRLSPVAVLGDGYINLINGPEDHGWCHDYTCYKRLSTFFTLVATDHHFDIFFTSTNPQKLRLTLLNVSPTEAIRVAIYYAKPEQLDVYVSGHYREPTNVILKADSQMVFQEPDEGNFVPDISGGNSGDNYFGRLHKMLSVIVRGPEPIDIVVSPTIIFKLHIPHTTVDEFFGENLVQNLALFLGISSTRIKVVNIVRESKRKRRAAETTVEVEITTEERLEQIDILTNATDERLDAARDSMYNISQTLIMSTQLGVLGAALNMSLLNVEIEEPMPSTGTPEWRSITDGLMQTGSAKQDVLIPEKIHAVQSSYTGVEMSRLDIIPVIDILDAQGEHVEFLGTVLNGWQVTATLVHGTGSAAEAVLTGTTTVTFVNGYANFTDITISHSGTGYMIKFMVTSPSEGNFLVETLGPFTMTQRLLTARTVAMERSFIKNNRVNVTIEIIDKLTKETAQELFWKGHGWTCSVKLTDKANYPGQLVATIDTHTLGHDPEVTFTDLQLNHIGQTAFVFECKTIPESIYSFVAESSVFKVIRPDSKLLVTEVKKEIQIKFNEEYAVIVGEEELFIAVVDNYLTSTFTEVIWDNYTLQQGSILVSFTMAGPTTSVDDAVEDLWLVLQSGLSLRFVNVTMQAGPYLRVNGERIDTDSVEKTEEESLNVGLIVGTGVGGGVLIFVIVMLVVLCSKKSKKQVGVYDTSFNGSTAPIAKTIATSVDAPFTISSPRIFTGINGSDEARSTSPTSSSSSHSASSRENLLHGHNRESQLYCMKGEPPKTQEEIQGSTGIQGKEARPDELDEKN